jgi:hypothetical protein
MSTVLLETRHEQVWPLMYRDIPQNIIKSFTSIKGNYHMKY